MKEYVLERLRQTRVDRVNDTYRFKLIYDGITYEIKCVGAMTVCFGDAEDKLPELLQGKIIDDIYTCIDIHERG